MVYGDQKSTSQLQIVLTPISNWIELFVRNHKLVLSDLTQQLIHTNSMWNCITVRLKYKQNNIHILNDSTTLYIMPNMTIKLWFIRSEYNSILFLISKVRRTKGGRKYIPTPKVIIVHSHYQQNNYHSNAFFRALHSSYCTWMHNFPTCGSSNNIIRYRVRCWLLCGGAVLMRHPFHIPFAVLWILSMRCETMGQRANVLCCDS